MFPGPRSEGRTRHRAPSAQLPRGCRRAQEAQRFTWLYSPAQNAQAHENADGLLPPPDMNWQFKE